MKIVAVGEALPSHTYSQKEILARLQELWRDDPRVASRLATMSENVMVNTRHLAQPLGDYRKDATFGETNDTWIAAAVDLGEQAVKSALAPAGIRADEVDAIFFSTVTGVASPSIDARLMNRVPFRTDLKRVPMFGLGCVAGAAALSRAADFLRGDPNGVVLVLTVELCSLNLQLADRSVANLISTALFGDGAAAAVVVGAERAAHAEGPRILATRSVFYPDTQDVMGWHITEAGFQIVLSAAVPTIAREQLPQDIDAFLRAQGVSRDDIGVWVCHPGGPKVLQGLQEGLELDGAALAKSFAGLARCGNLSSTSALLVLRHTMAEAPAGGTLGLMLAMGPGFCSELLLLKW